MVIGVSPEGTSAPSAPSVYVGRVATDFVAQYRSRLDERAATPRADQYSESRRSTMALAAAQS